MISLPINLNPVKTLFNSTPYFSQIFSVKGVETSDFAATGSLGNTSFSIFPRQMYSSIITPTSLPVKSSYPSLVLTAIPTLSQSGSVAISKSASFSFAYFKPNVNASLISGFGYGQVVKFPSGFSCSGTTNTSLYPAISKTFLTGSLPVPFNGVKTIFNSVFSIASWKILSLSAFS